MQKRCFESPMWLFSKNGCTKLLGFLAFSLKLDNFKGFILRPRHPAKPPPPRNPAGARMKSGVVGSKREHGTRTE